MFSTQNVSATTPIFMWSTWLSNEIPRPIVLIVGVKNNTSFARFPFTLKCCLKPGTLENAKVHFPAVKFINGFVIKRGKNRIISCWMYIVASGFRDFLADFSPLEIL